MNDEAAPKDGLDRVPETVAAEDDGAEFSPPSVCIVIEVEARPRLVWNCLSDQEFLRLQHWISSRPELEEIVGRAILASSAFLERVFGDEVGE